MCAQFQRKLARIDIAVGDLEEARARFARSLKVAEPEIELQPRGIGSDPSEAHLRTAVFQLGLLQIALIESPDPGALLGDCVRVLTFHTDEMASAIGHLTEIGAKIVFRTTKDEDGGYAILDARKPLSCYLELLDSSSDSKKQPDLEP